VHASKLAQTLLRAYAGGLIEISSYPPAMTLQAGEQPRASPLARLQAEAGSRVINLRHHNVEVDDVFRLELLKLLDGTRDRHAIVEELAQRLELTGDAMATEAGADTVQRAIRARLDDDLASLAHMALLAA
jgi:hypothetical protein